MGLLGDLWIFLRQLAGQFSWPGLLLSLAGAGWLWTRRRKFLLGTAALLLLDGIYSVWINPMGLEDRQNGLISSLVLAIMGPVSLADEEVSPFDRNIAFSLSLLATDRHSSPRGD